ncbi:hypothetical protein P7C71_g1413, partial [Lecanoromycetidae sp. Uapishka_2]
MDTRKTLNRRQQTQYLVAYNLISAILWSAILARVLLLIPLVGFENVYGGVGEFAKWTQTLALLEVVHSTLGIVRSPLLTTLIQVSSRLLLVWGVVNRYPAATSPSPFYSSMLFAWEGGGLIDESEGSYILYTHMMTQRKKTMRGKGVERS